MKRIINSTVIVTLFMLTMVLPGCQKNDVSPGDTGSENSGTATSDMSRFREHKILILMYHDVVPGTPTDIYQRNATDFENDLVYIKSKHYEILNFDDLLRLKHGWKRLTSDAVIFSFDDGFISNYTTTYPLLKKYNIPATFFVVTEWLNQPDRMTWGNVWTIDQYRDSWGRKPFSIESHTSSHPFLLQNAANFATPAAYQASLNNEIGDSKAWIQNVTGQSTMWLALPYGDGANDPVIINTAKKYGYSGIRTSIYGSFTLNTMDRYALPSLPILSTTSITDVQNYLN